jgi:hypothetical protein
MLCAGVSPRPASGQDVVGPRHEAGLFSFRVGDRPARTLSVEVAGDSIILLPFAEVMDVTGTAYGIGTGDRFWSESSEGVAADTVLRQIASDSLTVQLAASELVIIDGVLYIAADRVAEVLRSDISVDWRTLAVRLDREQAFPAEVGAASAQRRAALVPARRSAGEGIPFIPRWGGLVLDWEFSASGVDPRRNMTLSPTLSTAIWGGELRVGAITGTDALGDAAPVQPLASYSRVFPTGRAIRQLDVGDVLADGVVAEQLKGFRITNTPHRQADVFGLVPIRADLPPGWEYEVYQDGRLVGFSDAISDGAPPAAVRYGTTGVRIREIGPGGETRVRDLTFSVPFSMAPKGSMRYDLGAGACRWHTCRWGAFGTMRYGVTHALTVGGGVNYRGSAEDGGSATLIPHASIAAGSARGLSGELQVEGGGAGYANFQFSGRGRLSFSGGGRIDRALQGAATGARYWSSDASAVYRLGAGGLATARLTARLDGETQAGVERWSTSAALYHSAGTVEAGVSGGARSTAPPTVDLRSTYLSPRFRGTLPASLTAAASMDADGIQRADAGVSLGLGRFGSVTANARWERGVPRPALELGFSASRGGLRVQGRTSTDTARAPHRLLVSGSGSVAWVGAAGLRTSPAQSGGAGGIVGRVYFDRDADGAYTRGDSALAGQEVHVGGRAVLTDGQGLYAAWGLAAYEVAAVKLPPAGASNPNLSPAAPEHRVRLNPDRPETVDFALVTTRAVGGKLTGAVPEAQLGGLRLELRDTSGAVVETTTFEDGAWYVPRLRPGSYVVSVAEGALRAIGAFSDPVQVVVGAVGDEEIAAPHISLRWVDHPHASAGGAAIPDDSDQNHAPVASAPAPDISEVHDDTYANPAGGVWPAIAPAVRDDAGRVQPRREDGGGRRADRSTAGAGAVAPVRRGVLAGAGVRADGRVEHRGPVLHGGAPREASPQSELPAGAAAVGGDGAGEGDARQDEQPERTEPPEQLIYAVEERRSLRPRKGMVRSR